MIENFIKSVFFVALFGLFPSVLYSQIYLAEEITHFNTNINPSVVISNSTDKLLRLSHSGFPLNTGSFRSSSLQFSKSIPALFAGTGISFKNQFYEKNCHYSYTSLSLAYRNIIFNKAFISIGVAPKFIKVKAPNGIFSNYDFEENLTGYSKNTVNINLSISIFSQKDNYFLSGGIANFIPEFMELSDNRHFPVYRFINAGNFYKLVKPGSTNTRIFFTYYNTNDSDGLDRNSYMVFYSTPFSSSRYSSWVAGFFACYSDDSVLDISPVLMLHKGTRRQGIDYRLSAVTGYNCNDYSNVYKVKIQFSINYKFL